MSDSNTVDSGASSLSEDVQQQQTTTSHTMSTIYLDGDL